MIRFGNTVGSEVGKTVAPSSMGIPASPSMATVPAGAVSPYEPEVLGKTVAPESYRKREEQENKTVAIFQKKYNVSPIVGWLVCIDGEEKGKDFHLWAKINTIGRSESMDVCLKGDPTISKENHARLAYDPKHNNFRLIPGTSSNNIYLNDEPIYVPTKIEAYDVIEIGEVKLIFIPLCGEKFSWEGRLEK